MGNKKQELQKIARIINADFSKADFSVTLHFEGTDTERNASEIRLNQYLRHLPKTAALRRTTNGCLPDKQRT